MEENRLNLSGESLDDLSIEELTELKMETEDLLSKIDELIEDCDETINS